MSCLIRRKGQRMINMVMPASILQEAVARVVPALMVILVISSATFLETSLAVAVVVAAVSVPIAVMISDTTWN